MILNFWPFNRKYVRISFVRTPDRTYMQYHLRGRVTRADLENVVQWCSDVAELGTTDESAVKEALEILNKHD
jgi:hypothetical protein